MDNLNLLAQDTEKAKEDVTLTMEQRDEVIKTLQEEVEKNENLKVLRDLPSNNGVEEHEPEEGEYRNAKVSVNPETGERVVLNANVEEKEDNDTLPTFEEAFGDLGDSLNNSSSEYEFKYDINEEDLKKLSEEDGTIVGNYSISDMTAVLLLKVVNRKRAGETIKFNDLPEEIKDHINKYCRENGVVGYSNRDNYIRNELTNQLLEEYIDQIGLIKIQDDFSKSIEDMYKEAGKELSPMFKEYNDNRAEYLKKMTEKIDDEEKKKVAEEVMDSINDAYQLNRIRDLEDHSIKIKKYYLEEPKKIYNDFLFRYKDSKYEIYDLSMVETILDRHLKSKQFISAEDTDTARKIMVAFALFCQNYNLSRPQDHAFMYYFTYNVILLDIYQENDYEEFATGFLSNVIGIMDKVR